MKATELREKNVDELKGLVLELREQQFKARMQSATGQLNNPRELTAIRRDIARAKTVLNELQGK